MTPRLVPSPAASDRGATIVEYALLLALVAVVAIGALSLLGGNASDQYDEVAASISDGDSVGTAPSNNSSGGNISGGNNSGGSNNSGGNNSGGNNDDDGEVAGEHLENDPTPPANPPPADPPVEESPVDEPPSVSEFASYSATRVGVSHNWTTSVSLAISGADGAPLIGSAQVRIRVIELGTDRRGNPVEVVSERMVPVNNGNGSTSDLRRDSNANRSHHAITSITYVVLDVVPTSGGTSIGWDGVTPQVTVLAP